MTRAASQLLDASEIEAINLFCSARVRELIFGEHASVFTGTRGFDFSGIRDFEPGDPQIRVDWAHSTTTLYNPLQVREIHRGTLHRYRDRRGRLLLHEVRRRRRLDR